MYFLCLHTDVFAQSVVSVLCCHTLCAEILTGHIAAENTEARILVACMKTNARACRLVLRALGVMPDGEGRDVEGQAVSKVDGSQANEKGNRAGMVAQRPGC